MNDERVIEAINRFLSKRFYNYALLIDGPWGCGKTYFIREKLIPLIEQNYSVTYISLYGLKDASSISDTVYSKILAEVAEKRFSTKFVQGASILLRTAAKWGLQKLEVEPDKDLDELIKLLPKFNNRILIFDDLERCNCSINEALGQINSFVEYSDAHVIIVANEAEIGKGYNQNKDIQTLVALNKDLKVAVPKTHVEMMLEGVKGEVKEPEWTPEYIERRRRVVFQNDEQYRRIKEKIVGLTIRYEPDLKKVFTGIITGADLKDSFLSACGRNIDRLVFYANRDDHHNIRTFQFFLEKCSTIYEIADTVHDDILLYTFRSSIRYMSGKPMPKWENDFGQQEFNSGFSSDDIMMGFRFVDELITKNHIDLKYASELIAYYERMMEAEGRLEGDPYQKLGNWYRMEDHEVEDCLRQIKENIIAGKYSTLIFPRIINYTATFESRGVFVDSSRGIIEAIKGYIERADKSRLAPFSAEQFIMADENSVKLYRQRLDVVHKHIKERLEIIEQDEVLIEEDDEHWGEKLLNTTTRDTYIHGHSFVYQMEPNELCELIKRGDNKQLDCFRIALSNLYGNRAFYEKMADDYDHLKRLKELVDEMEPVGAVKGFVIGWLRKNLKDYFEKVRAEWDSYSKATVE